MPSSDDFVGIAQILAEYGHVVDDHDWDRAHLVFTDDVVFEMGEQRQMCASSETGSAT